MADDEQGGHHGRVQQHFTWNAGKRTRLLARRRQESLTSSTQDFYPTFLKDQLGFDATQVTVISVVGQVSS